MPCTPTELMVRRLALETWVLRELKEGRGGTDKPVLFCSGNPGGAKHVWGK